jgi:MFS family permease
MGWFLTETHQPPGCPVTGSTEGQTFCPSNPPTMHHRSTFGSLRTRNYRLFVAGQLFSNTGSWVLRIAQDWLVLTLTGSTAAVGATIALQFLPTVVLGMGGGWLADRYSKRAILLSTYVGYATMAGLLAGLTLSGEVRAWHVQLIAVGVGVIDAMHNPSRQAFVNDLVGPDQLRNAISLNSAVYQLGGLLGPALSGLLISAVGPGWSFLITAISYTAPVITLARLRQSQLHTPRPTGAPHHQSPAGLLRREATRPDILWPTILVGAYGMFTANLPVTLAAYAKFVFHSGPSGYGLLSTLVAVGSIAGALISARQPRTRLRTLMLLAAVLSGLYLLAAVSPAPVIFYTLLLCIGASTVLLYTSANSTVQLATSNAIRGRIMSIYLIAFVGSAAIGGPLLGIIDQHLGPREGLLAAGTVPGIITLLIATRLTMRLWAANHAPLAMRA